MSVCVRILYRSVSSVPLFLFVSPRHDGGFDQNKCRSMTFLMEGDSSLFIGESSGIVMVLCVVGSFTFYDFCCFDLIFH